MLTVLSNIPSLALSRNAVLLKLKATDDAGEPFAAKGRQLQVISDGAAGIVEDDSILINFQEPTGIAQNILFTAKDTPLTENQIPTENTDTYPSLFDYFTAVAEKIQAHPRIYPVFRVYPATIDGAEAFVMQAIDTDDDFTISVTLFNIANAGYSYEIIAPIASNIYNNYKVFADVVFETEYQTGRYERVATLEGAVDSNSNLTFDFSSILHKSFQNSMPTPPIPAWNNTEPYLADNLRRYYVRLYETYDGSDSVAEFLSSIHNTIYGGISQNLYADFDFFGSLGADNSLLTWLPEGRSIATDQDEYIFWYNYTGADKVISLETSIHNAAGTNITPTKYSDGITVPAGQTAVIPVGYTQLDIESDAIDNPLYYDVRVLDYDELQSLNFVYYSQSRRYYIDYAYSEETRYLMYMNGFGLPEVLRCTGNFSNQLEIDRQESRAILAPEFFGTAREKIQYDQDYDNVFTYRTGWLTPLEKEALQELLIYGMAYEVYDAGYIPLQIETNKFRIYDTQDRLVALEFSATPALKARNYSNLQIPLNEDQRAWKISNELQYWRTVFGLTWKLS
jgi:hypothetical protein